LSDEYSHMALNNLNYRICDLDLSQGRVDVEWQGAPVANYQKDMETPPPYGRGRLKFVPDTRVWKDDAELPATALKVGDLIKVNVVSELPGRPSHCTDAWIVENPGIRPRPKKK